MRYGTCDFCKRQANINHYRGPKNADVDDGEYGDLLSGEEAEDLHGRRISYDGERMLFLDEVA